MINLVSLFIFLINLTPYLTQTLPEIIWSKQIGSTGDDKILSITFDSDAQNIYATGFASGELEGTTNSGGKDLFLSKYDTDGNIKWTKQLGSNQDEEALSIIFDSNDIYVAGITKGTMDVPNKGGIDAFITKYDADGNNKWTRQFGSSNDDSVKSLAINTNTKNIFMTGLTYDHFGGGTLLGNGDAFIMEYDKEGNFISFSSIGTDQLDLGKSITIDSTNNYIYVGGSTEGSFPNNSIKGGTDFFLAKYDLSGNKEWIIQDGTSENDSIESIFLNPDRNYIYITGTTKGKLDSDPFLGEGDCFIGKYDKNGTKIWIKQFGTTNDDQSKSITVSADGNFIYITGITFRLYLNGGITDRYESFIGKYDKEGNQIWIRYIESIDKNEITGESIIVDPNNNYVYISGGIKGYLNGNTNKGGYDGYIFKMPSFKCQISCETCSEENSNICKKCAKNYFKKEDVDFPTQCYTGTTSIIGYYFDSTTFKRCNTGCGACTSSGCTSCTSGYFKKEDVSFPTDCYLSTASIEGYYFGSTAFKKCNTGCSSCTTSGTECLSCTTGYFKKEDVFFPTDCYLSSTSIEGYYFDTTAFKRCNAGCVACISFDSCTSCKENYYKKEDVSFPTDCYSNTAAVVGYYFYITAFKKCNTGCLACTSTGICISCTKGYFKKEDVNFPSDCYPSTTVFEGYYYGITAFKRCNAGCLTCSSSDDCTSCASEYYKKEDISFPTECFLSNAIVGGYYFDNTAFKKCDDSCSTCSSYKICNLCASGYYKKEDTEFPIECYSSSTVIEGYYYDISSFIKCNTNCLTCESTDNCLDCASGYFKKEDVSFPTDCYLSTSAVVGYYFENTAFKKCNTDCSTCTSSEGCTSCAIGYFKKEDVSFPTQCYKSSIVFEGYYFDNTDYKKCDTSCSTCTSFDVCISCAAEYFKKEDIIYPTKCYTSNTDVVGYYFYNTAFKICDTSCSTCTSSGCTKCANFLGYFKKEDIDFPTDCYRSSTVFEGYYFDNTAFKRCESGCSTCTSSEGCTSCATGYFRKEDISFPTDCYLSTHDVVGYYFDSLVFKRCGDSCSTCTSFDICTSCATGFHKKEDIDFPTQCYTSDTVFEGYFYDNSAFKRCYIGCLECTSTTYKSCTSCVAGYFKKQETDFPTECFPGSSVFDGYYLDSAFKKCNNGCVACLSFDSCTTCKADYYKKADMDFPTGCFLRTASVLGYYFDETIFKKCDNSCLTCSSYKNCTTCAAGYFKKENINYPTSCYSEKTYLEGFYFGGKSFKKCGNFCSVCSPNQSCLSCIDGYLKKPGVDIHTECYSGSSPPDGYFFNGSSIEKCESGCLKCSSKDNCNTCIAGYFKKHQTNFSTQCFGNTPDGYFLKNNEYFKCSPNCSICNSERSDGCLACKMAYFKKSEVSFPTECFDNAPDGYFFNNNEYIRKDFIKSNIGLNSTLIPLERLDDIVKKNINTITKNSTELLNFAIIIDKRLKVEKIKIEDVLKLIEINDKIICNIYIYENFFFQLYIPFNKLNFGFEK